MRVKLSDAFDLQMGKTPSRGEPDYWNGENAWVSIADLSNAGKKISETKECITDIGVAKSGIRVVPRNTVIMSFKLSIGKTAITAEDMYTNEAIMAFIDKGVCPINVHYLYHLFSNMDWSEGSNKAVMGITLTKATLSEKVIELPDMAEQQEVAAMLDHMDTLISLRKQQIAKLDELVKARFVEMFGDPKDNRFNWDTVSLGSLFSVGSSKRIYQNEQVPQGIPFLRISDLMERIEHGIDTAELFISKEKFDELQQDGLVPKCGDILVTSRGTLGRCYEIKSDDQFYFQDGMISWLSERSDRVNNTYIMNLFSMPGFRKQIDDVPAGSTVNYLSLARLKSLQVMCPPIDLQHQFAAFVAQTDQQKLTIQHSLAKLETLKKSLMQMYFG